MRGPRRFLLLTVTSMLAASVLSVYWLVSTSSGLQWLINRFDKTVQVSAIEGSLWDGFEAESIVVKMSAAQLKSERARLRIDFSTLWDSRLTLKLLTFDDLVVQLPANKNTSSGGKIELPFDLALEQLEVNKLRIERDRNPIIEVNSLQLAVSLINDRLTVQKFAANGAGLSLNVAGSLADINNRGSTFELQHEFAYAVNHEHTVKGSGRLQGTLEESQFHLTTSGPLQSETHGTASLGPDSAIEWNANTNVVRAQISRQNAEPVEFSGTVISESLDGSIVLVPELHVRFGQQSRTLTGRLVNRGNRLEFDNLRLSNPALRIAASNKAPQSTDTLKIDGIIDNYVSLFATRDSQQRAGDLEKLDVRLQWSNFSMIKTLLNSEINSPEGSAKLTGNMDDYQIQMSAQLSGPDPRLHTGSLTFNGAGNRQQLQLDNVNLSGPLGSGNGTARVSWGDRIEWQANLSVQNIRPDIRFSKWPGTLSANIRGSGQIGQQSQQAQLKVDNVSGQLKGLPLQGNASIQLAKDKIQIDSLDARLGGSTISAKGSLSDKFDLVWSMEAPELNLFNQQLVGALSTSGKLQGSREFPRVEARMVASNLRYQKTQLDSIEGEISLDMSDSGAWRGLLSMGKFSDNNHMVFERSTWSLSGSTTQHRLETVAYTAHGQEQHASLSGRWSRSFWSGRLEKLDLMDGEQNQWQIQTPAALLFSSSEKRVSDLCLASPASGSLVQRLCLSASQMGEALAGKLQISNLSSSIAQRRLRPLGIDLQGTLDGEFELSGNVNDWSGMRAQGGLHSDNGSVTYQPAVTNNGAPQSNGDQPTQQRQIRYSDLELTIKLGQPSTFKIHSALEQNGQLNIELTSSESPFSERFQQAALGGRAEVLIPDISVLSAFRLDHAALSGSLEADGSVAGTVGQPVFSTNLALQNSMFELPSLGIRLSELNASVATDSDNTARIAADAKSGEGKLEISGSMDLSDIRQLKVILDIKADNALFIDTPSMHAKGDAELRMELKALNVDISGAINIDQANLDVGDRLGVVYESDDVIFAGDLPDENAITSTLDVVLNLGSNTHISANGLTGRLSGEPNIRKNTEGLITSVGDISIVDGRYVAYGKTLVIDKGRASYAGGEISNPELFVEATRTIEGARVGIAIRGTAEQPEINLFSEPTLNDQDILSMLLFGKKVEALSSSDGLKLLTMAKLLSGGKAGSKSQIGRVTEGVADYFGLQEISVDLESLNDQQIVSINTQVTSRLSVGYVYNFLSSVQALLVRYKISDRWSVQSTIDVESGADFRYEVKRD